MIQAEAAIWIDRQVEEVFAFVANPRNALKWQPGLLAIHCLTTHAVGLGARTIAARAVADTVIEIFSECVTFEPNRRIQFSGHCDSSLCSTTYLFALLTHGTKLTQQTQIAKDEWSIVSDDAMAAIRQAELAAELQALKALLEGQPVLNRR
jgi:hypothetical protein